MIFEAWGDLGAVLGVPWAGVVCQECLLGVPVGSRVGNLTEAQLARPAARLHRPARAPAVRHVDRPGEPALPRRQGRRRRRRRDPTARQPREREGWPPPARRAEDARGGDPGRHVEWHVGRGRRRLRKRRGQKRPRFTLATSSRA